jgi:hypothetical protein
MLDQVELCSRVGMRIRLTERPLEAASQGDRIVLRQEFSYVSQRTRALMLTCAGGLLSAPFVMILATGPARAQLATMPTDVPFAAASLALAATIGFSAFALGIRQCLIPAVRRREIEIDPVAQVVVVKETINGTLRQWKEPIKDYLGVRHRVATTSEGAIHALILEHRRPERTVHIAYQMNIADRFVAETADRLGLQILTPSQGALAHSLARIRPAALILRVRRRWLRGNAQVINAARWIANA